MCEKNQTVQGTLTPNCDDCHTAEKKEDKEDVQSDDASLTFKITKLLQNTSRAIPTSAKLVDFKKRQLRTPIYVDSSRSAASGFLLQTRQVESTGAILTANHSSQTDDKKIIMIN